MLAGPRQSRRDERRALARAREAPLPDLSRLARWDDASLTMGIATSEPDGEAFALEYAVPVAAHLGLELVGVEPSAPGTAKRGATWSGRLRFRPFG